MSRKNAFQYFAVSVLIASLFYALASGIAALGEGQAYPALQGGAVLAMLLGGWLLLCIASGLAARRYPRGALREAAWTKRAEAAAVALVLIAATALRLFAVRALPMQTASDYRTYYEIAELIAKGTLRADGPGYCDYIALFPHVYGYPFALSRVFRLFGISVAAAQGFNVALSVLTVFLTYRAARMAGGRLCGMVALMLTAFWPSQIVYVNMVASEYLFSCMLMLALCVFIRTVRVPPRDVEHPAVCALLHVFLGAWLALCAAVRPMALLLVITIVLCVGAERFPLPARRTADLPVSLRFLSRGWLRCLAVVAAYMAVSGLITVGVTNAVDRDLAQGTTSFGYNLLVGLNAEAEGGWNQADSDYLYAALEETGDATRAHAACRDLALKRLADVKGTLNLFLRKFQALWMNDDYGATWNLLFMGQQGTLTPERESFLFAVRSWGSMLYLLSIGLAIAGGIGFWQKGAGLGYPFLLMVLGTMAMHLLVESQNRYHFHALYMLAVLAAFGVKSACEGSRLRERQRQQERRRLDGEAREDEKKREALLREEEHLTALRREAMGCRFDLEDALQKGLVTVRVTRACQGAQEAEGRP